MPHHPITIHMGNVMTSTTEGQHAASISYTRLFRSSTGEIRQCCVLARHSTEMRRPAIEEAPRLRVPLGWDDRRFVWDFGGFLGNVRVFGILGHIYK